MEQTPKHNGIETTGKYHRIKAVAVRDEVRSGLKSVVELPSLKILESVHYGS